MKKVMQEFLHNPTLGIKGDCQRAVIASILEKDISEVPHFAESTDGIDKFYDKLESYLKSVGYHRFTFPVKGDPKEVMDYMMNNNPNTMYMLAGYSPRMISHVVICRNDELLHDPHPQGGGIVKSYIDPYWNSPYCSVDILVPLNLAFGDI